MAAPRPFLYLAFFLSGAAALVFESVWTRYLGLLLGHTAQAQVLVLTLFLCGMAFGAAATGRVSDALRRPLLWYGVVEIVVGLMGLAFHVLFVVMSDLSYERLFPAVGDSQGLLTAVKTLTAVLLILPPSVLLGATFPLLAAAVLRLGTANSVVQLERLYFVNAFGGAIGVLLGGFLLLPRLHLPGTLAAAGGMSIVAGIIAIAVQFGMLSRLAPTAAGAQAAPDAAATSDVPATPSRRPWLLLAIAFGTALASFGYEVAWIRMLSLVLGSATHSFEIMLSAFILGLAIGGALIAWRGAGIRNPVRALGIIQCAMGALAVATLPLYVASFTWVAQLLDVFARTAGGYVGFTVGRYLICAVIMLPATICAGMTLPLITRILQGNAARESAIGYVYAANTAGSIIGVQIAALVAMPLFGVKAVLVGAAIIDVAIGIVIFTAAYRSPWPRHLLWVTTAALAAIATVALATGLDSRLLSSGMFRIGRTVQWQTWSTLRHEDGRTATITVRRSAAGDVVLTTNGKPDASIPWYWLRTDTTTPQRRPLSEDVATQILLPLVALAHRPDAGSVAVIGHGSGLTTHVLLGSPALRRVTTVEIEPEVYHASLSFLPFNARAFDDPRSEFVVDDARAFFAGRATTFDLIVSEPSNPWVSGVSGLFTVEFYQHVHRRLSEHGVLAQWLNLYEMDDDLVRSVLAAVDRVFPSYALYLTTRSDLLVIASPAATLPRPDWSVAALPAIRSDFARGPRPIADDLDALFVADNRLLAPALRAATPNSDFAPTLDMGGERARFFGRTAAGFQGISFGPYDFASALAERRMPFARSDTVLVDVPRLWVRAAGATARHPERTPMTDADIAARDRRDVHDRVVRSGRPPADWNIWMRSVVLIDRDLHAGTAGVVDTAFYAPLYRYMRRMQPPPGIRATVAFLHAGNSWDFPEAARASEALLEYRRDRISWVMAEHLRDVGVTAMLRQGDGTAAMRFYSALAPEMPADYATRFRSSLLLARIVDAIAVRGRQGN